MAERSADPPPIKAEQRRSSRFPVLVPVEVKWKEPSGNTVKEVAQAKEVNAQGGLLDMKDLPLGRRRPWSSSRPSRACTGASRICSGTVNPNRTSARSLPKNPAIKATVSPCTVSG